jgi:hypothetical protein
VFKNLLSLEWIQGEVTRAPRLAPGALGSSLERLASTQTDVKVSDFRTDIYMYNISISFGTRDPRLASGALGVQEPLDQR